MVKRHERKYKQYLGSRTWGGGNTKNRRGKGSRGGKGRAGSHKHRWTWTVNNEPDRFGTHGFSPLVRSEIEVINVSRITDLANTGALKKEGGVMKFIFKGKVLGAGEINVPVSVTAAAFSESAKKKITAAGGSVTVADGKAGKNASKEGSE